MKTKLEKDLNELEERELNRKALETIKKIYSAPKRRKSFTILLLFSKLLVFAAFLYTSVTMFNLGRQFEGAIILFAVALWVILTEMDKGV